MRQIKFRGKSIAKGEWVNGCHIIDAKGKTFIKPYKEFAMTAVNPETVGQWTGLLDSEDYKIFEGDILKITGDDDSGNYIVIWDPYRVAWWGKNVKCDKRNLVYDDDYFQLLGCTFQKLRRLVIGNIHDDPELLDS